MKEENSFLKRLKNLLKIDEPVKTKDGNKKKSSFYFYMLMLLAIGVVIMMGSELLTAQQESTEPSSAIPALNETVAEDVETFGKKNDQAVKTIEDYERSFENEIKEALEHITGVSDVSVVVNVDATEKQIYEKNNVTQKQVTDEIDREGGKRTVEDTSKDEQIVIVRNGDKEVPIVQETKKPQVRGVLVVAQGADNISVKKMIVEAVTRVLDIETHKVAVMPKK